MTRAQINSSTALIERGDAGLLTLAGVRKSRLSIRVGTSEQVAGVQSDRGTVRVAPGIE